MKKFDGILSHLYAVFGGFTFLCFAWYFSKLIIQSEGALPWIATVTVMVAVGVPFLFRRRLRAWLKKAYVPLKAVMCLAMMFYTVSFAFLVGYIYLSPSTSVYPTEGQKNVYLVFGAKINRYGPTVTLAARLDAAYDALVLDPDALCIVSGGQGSDEVMTEAECMRDYLVGKGIDESRILVENKASNTAENIRFSIKLMEEQGLSDHRLICVSSNTHIPRIRLLCGREGVDAGYLKAEFPKKSMLFSTWVREYLSYAKMLLIGY